MGKPIIGHWDVPSSGQISALMVVSSFFFVGVIGGYSIATQIQGGDGEPIVTYLAQFFSSLQVGEVISPDILFLAWGLLRWPLMALLLGYTALGLLGIPVLFTVRGFLLSFSVSAFIRLYASAGGMVSFVLFGLSGVLSLPVLFVLGVDSFINARNIALSVSVEGRRNSLSGDYLVHCGWCAVVLGICVCIEVLFVPSLLLGLGQMLSLC